MENLLISACLMGFECKYSGGSNYIGDEELDALRKEYRLIPVCPEVSGGLPTPRDPSERIGDRVMSNHGRDVTAEYNKGADTAVFLAKKYGCRKAMMKSHSPSCGLGSIYDGSFSGVLVPGDGVAVEKLKAEGVEVLSR